MTPLRQTNDKRSATLVCLLVFLLVTGATADLVQGNDNDVDAINWAYQEALDDGFYFGTQENAQIYDLPLSYTFRSLENDDWGFELKFSITIGLYNIHSQEEEIDVSLLAIVPSIEFQFPVRNNWILMPVGHLRIG